MSIWKLEVGKCPEVASFVRIFVRVSPLNICRFGSWKLEFVSVTIEHV